MQALKNSICRLIRDERGATAIEYTIIASVMGLMLAPVMADTSSGVAALYQRVINYFAALT